MGFQKAEILAPCGSFESIRAAVRCGADAVYLGAKNFNARRNGENFDQAELFEAVQYCKLHGVKVHIAFNTLIADSEMIDALEFLKELCSLGVDALIIQDLGLASMAKKCAPELQMHASTQMSVQTAAGIELLQTLGFSTAVLPRELSKSEISAISANTSMRLEAFVHGALCMCVSGQCYLSAILGSRSGNRGLCAQPCRLPFAAPGGTGHDLSLKDLSLIPKAKALIDCGVSLLKVEGRMKRPEYVAAAVTALKKSLNGEHDEKSMESLKSIFARSGFTSGYFDGKTGREMFGIRTKEDVAASNEKLLSSLRSLFEKEKQGVPVLFSFEAKVGEPIKLTASCRSKTATANGSAPQKAKNVAATAESIKQQLNKCGGTAFFAEQISIDLDEELFIPSSEINTLRRTALSELELQLKKPTPIEFTPYQIPASIKRKRKPQIVLRLEIADQLPNDLSEVKAAIVPLGSEKAFVERRVPLAVEIPRGIFGGEKQISKMLEEAKQCGIKSAWANTLDAVALAKKVGMNIIGGFGLNAFNSLSVNSLENMGLTSITLSPELTLNRSGSISSTVPVGIIGYGRLPLMLMRNCPIKNGKSCAECGKNGFLTDRRGVRFPIRCSFMASELLNSRPIYLADKLDDVNADFIVLYFTIEKKSEVENIIQSYISKAAPAGEFTRGLSYRGVK